jgi:hypothetical protein
MTDTGAWCDLGTICHVVVGRRADCRGYAGW